MWILKPVMRLLRVSLATFSFACCAFVAQALPVNFDPQSYTGFYSIPGVTGNIKNLQTLDLTPGTYNLTIAFASPVQFTVDPTGTVSTANAAAFSTSANTISFNTAQIMIDPGDYDQNAVGDWSVRFAMDNVRSGNNPGPQTVDLVVGISNYGVAIGDVPAAFRISVDGAGNVSVSNPDSATGGAGTLVFNTVPVSIDPGDFDQNAVGDWSIFFISQKFRSGLNPGPKVVHLIPGVQNYSVQIGDAARAFKISLDGSGNVSTDTPSAASASGPNLTFNTVPIDIDPGEFDENSIGDWSILFVTQKFRSGLNPGTKTAYLVPGIGPYNVEIGQNFRAFHFNLDDAGNVVSGNTSAATASGQTLTFNTVDIEVDPDGYAPTWTTGGIDQATGVETIKLLPNITGYRLIAGSSVGVFQLDASGQPVPDLLPLTVGSDTFDFELGPAGPSVNPMPTCQEAKDGIVAAGIALASDVIQSNADGVINATGGTVSNSSGDDCFFLSASADKLQSDSRHGGNDEGAHIDTIVGMEWGDSLSFRIDGGFFADFIFKNGNNKALVPYYDLLFLADYLNDANRASGDQSAASYFSAVNGMKYVIDDSPNISGDEITLVAWNIGDLTTARPAVVDPPFIENPVSLDDVQQSIVLTGHYNAYDLYRSNKDNVITTLGGAVSNNDGDDLILLSMNGDQVRFDSRDGNNDEGEHVDVIAGMDGADSLTFRIDGGFFAGSAFQSGNANQGAVSFAQLSGFSTFLNDASRPANDESQAVFLTEVNSTLFVIDDSPGNDGDEISFIIWNGGDLTN